MDQEIYKENQEPTQTYVQAKFFTEIRQKLLTMDLKASVIGVFAAYHTICDADTGVFTRDDVQIREITDLPRSTVFWATNQLFKTELIAHRVDGTHEIVGYEALRKVEKPNYFRLTQSLFDVMPTLVHHKNAGLLLFALEMLDCSRHYNWEIVRSVETLVHEKHIGSTRIRAIQNLELLRGFAEWSVFPNKRDTDDLVQFWPIKGELNEHQERLRALHGKVSRDTRQGYIVSRGTNPPNWRELSRTTRKIIQYGMDHMLSENVVLKMGGLFGSMCAVYKIEHRLRYLRRILKNGDLHKLAVTGLKTRARLETAA